jgi:hypothetical protein
MCQIYYWIRSEVRRSYWWPRRRTVQVSESNRKLEPSTVVVMRYTNVRRCAEDKYHHRQLAARLAATGIMLSLFYYQDG